MNRLMAWLRAAANRGRKQRERQSLPFVLQSSSPATTTPVQEHEWLLAPPEKTDVLIVLTTCARAEVFAAQLIAFSAARKRLDPDLQVRFLILEDSSEEDYSAAYELAHQLFGSEGQWIKSVRRLKKSGYYQVYQAAFFFAESLAAEKVFFIQDDLDFEPDMLNKALELFATLKSQHNPRRPQVLNLYSAQDDEEDGRWTDFRRVPLAELPVRQTQWYDLQGYLIERETLQLLDYWVAPIPASRWKRNPLLSSGVGRQFTRRLRAKARTYQCYPPLIFHGAVESVMNPESRELRAMDNRELMSASPEAGD